MSPIPDGQFVVQSPLQQLPRGPSSTAPPPPPGIRSPRENAYVPNMDSNNDNDNPTSGPPRPPPPPPPSSMGSSTNIASSSSNFAEPMEFAYAPDSDRRIFTIPVPWQPYVPPNLAPLNPYIGENEQTYNPAPPDLNSLYNTGTMDYYVPSNNIAPPRVVSLQRAAAQRSTTSGPTSSTATIITSAPSPAPSNTASNSSRYRSRYDVTNDTTVTPRGNTTTVSPASSSTVSSRSLVSPLSRSISNQPSASNTSTNTRNIIQANPLHPNNRNIRNNILPTPHNDDDDDNDADYVNTIRASMVVNDDDEVPTSGPDNSSRPSNYISNAASSPANIRSNINNNRSTLRHQPIFPTSQPEPEEIEDDDPT